MSTCAAHSFIYEDARACALCEALAVEEGDEIKAADETAPPGLFLPDARPP